MRMKSLKKVTAILAAGAMVTAMFTGCASSEEKKTAGTNAKASDTASQDAVPVKLVMFGEESPRMKELMANEIHQKVLDEINVDLEIQYLPWTEYAGGKSELMFPQVKNSCATPIRKSLQKWLERVIMRMLQSC